MAVDSKRVTFWFSCNMLRHAEMIRLSMLLLERVGYNVHAAGGPSCCRGTAHDHQPDMHMSIMVPGNAVAGGDVGAGGRFGTPGLCAVASAYCANEHLFVGQPGKALLSASAFDHLCLA